MLPPIALFVYNRTDTLQRTLAGLRDDHVPLLYIFSDAPKTPTHAPSVAQVRQMIEAIDWAQTHITYRSTNMGLGRSIVAGVSAVLAEHESVIVFEDDLVCVPGTYRYFSDALQHYQTTEQVMSVTAWTNRELIPPGTTTPYFDGRAESLAWATWRRAWVGFPDQEALPLIRAYRNQGGDIQRYGEDVPVMALMERERNLWLVRWIAWHMAQGGLCLRPPYTMVQHIGYNAQASNAAESEWLQDDHPQSQIIPLSAYPPPIEHPQATSRWRRHRRDYWQRLPLATQLRAGAGIIRRMFRERFFFLPSN
jgi:hypothetical protein